MPNPTVKQRLFFALYPGAEDRARLHALGASTISPAAGRFVMADNLHLTLLFIGGATPEQAACLTRLGASVCAEPVSLIIDRLGQWRGPAVIWSGCTQVPSTLGPLVELLRSGAGDCGLSVDPRPFEVHITLVRNATRPFRTRELSEPLMLDFDRFCLMISHPSEDGTRYEVLASWPLRTRAPVEPRR